MAGLWKQGSAAAALALAAMTTASACAGEGLRMQCSVSGESKLPPGLTRDDLCRTFAAAIAEATGSKVTQVEAIAEGDTGNWAALDIAVRSPYALAANLRHGHGGTVGVVPQMELSTADRALSQPGVEQIARAIAAQVTSH